MGEYIWKLLLSELKLLVLQCCQLGFEIEEKFREINFQNPFI